MTFATFKHRTGFLRGVFFLSVPIVIGAVGVFLLVRSGVSNVAAQNSIFYPTTCSGWNNSENALGAPDVATNDVVGFNITNSAYYLDEGRDFVCANFSGTLPARTYQTRVLVRFSWYQVPFSPEVIKEANGLFAEFIELILPIGGDEKEDEEQVTGSEIVDEITHSSSTNEDALGTSTDTFVGEFTFASSTDNAIGTTSLIENIETNENGYTATQTPSVIEPAPDPVFQTDPVPEAPVEGQEEQHDSLPEERVPSPQTEEALLLDEVPNPERSEPGPESEPVVWWKKILPSVYAAELETATSTASTSNLSNAEAVSRSEDSIGMEAVLDAQFAVYYTFAIGDDWELLGYVTAVTSDVRFEIPNELLGTSTDLAQLQIKIVPLPRYDAVAPAYLDALWIEVEYALVEEMAVHTISDIVPSIVPTTALIAESMVEGQAVTSTATIPFTPATFADSLTFAHGIDERYVAAGVRQSATTTELWIFDLRTGMTHRLGAQKSALGNFSVGVKERMIFWFNSDEDILFTYDLRTAGQIHETLIAANAPRREEQRFTFPFTEWEVIVRAEQLYFFAPEHGELFRDENTDSVVQLFTELSLGQFLSPEAYYELAGVMIAHDERRSATVELVPDVEVMAATTTHEEIGVLSNDTEL
jgi:hypothetical protein